MSKLDKLIAKLCPDGIEYKTTKDIIKDSFWLMPATPAFVSEGIPYITSKNIKDGQIYFDNCKYITIDDFQKISNNRDIKYGDLLITMIGTIGEVAIVNINMNFYGQNLYLLRLNNAIIITKYFYYFITSSKIKLSLISKKNASSQGYIKANSIENLKIPLPPLPIQEEIVRILDKFTSLTAELTAELTARRKQYEFYRNALLSFKSEYVSTGGHEVSEKRAITHNTILENLMAELCPNGVEYKELREVTSISRGVRVTRNQLNNTGTIPVYQNSLTPLGYFTKSNCPDNTTFIICAGAAGEVGYSKNKFWAADDCYYFITPDFLNNKYLYYFLLYKNKYLKNKVRKASVPRLSRQSFERLSIPVPPLLIQQKIVNILDRFDALCNDLTSGLPAEIEARQKQYEYYRDKLLTFKELKTK